MWKVHGGLGREDTLVRRETEELRMKRPEGEWEIQVRIRSPPPSLRPKAADKEGRRQRAITKIQHAGLRDVAWMEREKESPRMATMFPR